MKSLFSKSEISLIKSLKDAVAQSASGVYYGAQDFFLSDSVKLLRMEWANYTTSLDHDNWHLRTRRFVRDLPFSGIQLARAYYLLYWLGYEIDDEVANQVDRLVSGPYVDYFAVPVHEKCRLLRYGSRGCYILGRDIDWLMQKLMQEGVTTDVAAATAHFMAFHRIKETVHTEIDTVRLWPVADYRLRRLKWTWRCPLCGLRHGVFMPAREMGPPTRVQTLCDVPSNVEYWNTEVTGKAVAKAEELFLEVAILNV
jgi:hypothetical protein